MGIIGFGNSFLYSQYPNWRKVCTKSKKRLISFFIRRRKKRKI